MKGITRYAQREYGVTARQLEAFMRASEHRSRKLLREGKLLTFETAEQFHRWAETNWKLRLPRKK